MDLSLKEITLKNANKLQYTQNTKPLPIYKLKKTKLMVANTNGLLKLVQKVKELEWNGLPNLQMANISSLLVSSRTMQFTLIRLFGRSIVLMVKSSGR